MALILNIESATNVCSVAVARAGKVLAIFETDTNNHASEMTLLIERCLSEADVNLPELDAVAVSHGPGSYTSLRVGASTAKGICYALNKPLIAVDTLHALAHGAYLKFGDKTAHYCPMIDARRMEVYTAVYAPNLSENTEGVVLKENLNNLIVESNSFERYFSERKRIIFVGNGAMKCAEVMQDEQAFFKQFVCSSAYLAPLAELFFEQKKFEKVAYYTPEYLKAPNITTAKKKI